MEFKEQIENLKIVINTRPRIFIKWENSESGRDKADCYEKIIYSNNTFYRNTNNGNTVSIISNPSFYNILEELYNEARLKKIEKNETKSSKYSKSKNEIIRDSFKLFLKKEIPDNIFNNYVNDEDGEGSLALQDFVLNNMKDDLNEWSTGIGIIEAVEHLYKCAHENGNV